MVRAVRLLIWLSLGWLPALRRIARKAVIRQGPSRSPGEALPTRRSSGGAGVDAGDVPGRRAGAAAVVEGVSPGLARLRGIVGVGPVDLVHVAEARPGGE